MWTAGQRPSPLVTEMGVPLDERDRLIVDDHLRVPEHSDLYAIGDAAAVPDPDGGTCPMTAQHALRQGLAVAANVAAGFGVGEPAPFTYRNRGMAVTLGRGDGTAEVRRLMFRGRLAWWMGRSYHLLMMPGWGRRLRVVSDWTIGLLFPSRPRPAGLARVPAEAHLRALRRDRPATRSPIPSPGSPRSGATEARRSPPTPRDPPPPPSPSPP